VKVQPFGDNSPETSAERRSFPFLRWCRTYLPHYFCRDFAPFHREMLGAVGEPGMPTFIGAFRGAGKSVLLSLARPLWRALHGACPYFIYGSRVQRLAAQNMDYVRLELDHNERITQDYGEVGVSGAEDAWVAELPLAKRAAPDLPYPSIKFEAFGIGMSPRGRRHGARRPLEFVGDDLEDAELARNPQREKNLWDWMMDEVLPALEPRKWIFTVVGTTFGPGCMLERARELSEKTDPADRPLGKLFLQPATENGHSVWPQRFSDADFSRIRAIIGLRNWMRNFALKAEDPDKPFQPPWFGQYDQAQTNTDGLDKVAFLDPALSQAPTGCPRALVVVGCDRRTGVRYVLDAWITRGTPTEMVEKLFEVNERFRPRLIGVEANGGYALIKSMLAMEEERRGRVLPVRYVNHSRPKELRIETLCPQFEQGRWRFPSRPSPGVQTLQEQFASYPDGFVDGPDACAGCDELLPDSFRPAASAALYRSIGKRTDYACV